MSVDALYEDDQLIIINYINPVAEKHFLAIPCGNYVNYNLSLYIYINIYIYAYIYTHIYTHIYIYILCIYGHTHTHHIDF